MSRIRQLAGGGRAVEVAPERLAGWFDRFAASHGGAARTVVRAQRVEVHAADGASAAVDVPFGPLPPPHGEQPGLAVRALVEHVNRPRRIGLVLVRLGAHSVGIAYGGEVEQSATDRHLVHGRNKAGGWSQQRFARRRAGQSRRSLDAAADAVARLLLPARDRLDAVVLGGDRHALEALRTDSRLAELLARAEARVLDVPEPRRAVLDDAARRAVAVEIEVREADRV
ncbi:acVLRF1 family peptidyl-tRNA hydrolase [Saccharopolyspora sp. 5N708]|uniref:acVLRF1 family peptidyl-tRNA hydrolase n=1 Tax=Saccharopolyspora sp. 5N708 TaxID=3457424 RepID=UPI003FD14780